MWALQESFNKIYDQFSSLESYHDKQNMIDQLERLSDDIEENSVEHVNSPTVVKSTIGRPKREKRKLVGLEIESIKYDARVAAAAKSVKRPRPSDSDIQVEQTKKAKHEIKPMSETEGKCHY